MYETKDKVVVITGGAKGIGAEVVKTFLLEGAKHVAILDIDKAAGNELQNKLINKYGSDKLKFIECDVAKEDDLFAAMDMIYKDNGYIDVVINNAGIINEVNSVCIRKEVELNYKEEYYTLTGVRVLTICFGATETDILNQFNTFDDDVNVILKDLPSKYPMQTSEFAGKELVVAFKKGETGSTWLINNKPAQDITETIQKAYKMLSDLILP